jgi:hypothetical protein
MGVLKNPSQNVTEVEQVQNRLLSEIMKRILRRAERLAQPIERRRVGVVAIDILEQRRKLIERGGIDAASPVLLQTVARADAELLQAPAGPRYAIIGTFSMLFFTIACSAGKTFFKMTRAASNSF